MDSTAFLRRGFSPAPPLLPTTASVAGRLPLTFRCNVSSIRLLVEKSNKIENYNKHRSCNKNNNGIDIRCAQWAKSSSSFQDGDNFPYANAKGALQSLLAGLFSFDTPTGDSKIIVAEKKKALQSLLAQKSDQAVQRMRENVYQTYHKIGGQMKYDATLAFIQILIYVGTQESLKEAIEKLNEISKIVADEYKPSDAKPTLYRAIVYTLLSDESNEDVQEYWKTYVDYIGSGPSET